MHCRLANEPCNRLSVPPASAKINISYSILFNLTTSYSSYFEGKKGISRNKTSFFLLMCPQPPCGSIHTRVPLCWAMEHPGFGSG